MVEGEMDYFEMLEEALDKLYKIASEARSKLLDPAPEPEVKVATDMAELVEGLVGPKGVAESIRELSDKLSREELAFKIAEGIIYGKFGHMETEEALDQAIRTALAILTEGITAAPLQGIYKIAVKENFDRTKYLAIYFAGPIRSAGGTEQALTLVIGDFVRKLVGLDKYKPTEEEIGRFIEELRLYERNVGRFQYHISNGELRDALQLLPIEVTGVETNPLEVSSFRNLPRIETNRVRGGALRVVNDGIIGRAAKVLSIVEKLGIEGWDWLGRIREIKREKTAGFMEDVIAGRPIFAFPSRTGGFRLRYGRARNTGLSSVGIHPITMRLLGGFLASGTQIKIEGPGKAGITLPVDSIETPIVRLRDGSVVRVNEENFEKIKDHIEKILFLGDMLVSFGDFLYNNKPLKPSGINEEWWVEELKESLKLVKNDPKFKLDIENSRLEEFIADPYSVKPTPEEALKLSEKLHIPLHPKYTYNWANVEIEELRELREWLLKARDAPSKRELKGEFDSKVKRILEKALIPHMIVDGKISIRDEEYEVLRYLFKLDYAELEFPDLPSTLVALSKFSGIKLVNKMPTFIGARMGRPEKAKRREMKPLVHVLFPVGLHGGSRRDLIEASRKGEIFIEISRRRCPKCGEVTFRIYCLKCKVETKPEKICIRCRKSVDGDLCPVCKAPARAYDERRIDVASLLQEATAKVRYKPKLLKGVKGLTNEGKVCEALEKGVLRAKYDLSVFKDGTLRFDATNAPLTHFKPSEIGVSVDRLKALGYKCEWRGKPLESEDDLCELKIQDIIIPRSCAEYLLKVANFIDDLLEYFYGLPRFYNAQRIEDLVGHLVIGLAPHTSVGVLGRIIGFTNLSVCYAHPFWHSAKRRDCDGDEDAIMLALDTLINFSRTYLPSQIGGIMDAPLFLISKINPIELQRQAHNFDIASSYPLQFYYRTWEEAQPKSVLNLIETVGHHLERNSQPYSFGFTTPVSSILAGVVESAYKKFKRMVDKLDSQLSLAEKISAVDVEVVARNVLTTHFMRDVAGNLRAFTTQSLRCRRCNKRYRRPPLKGVCLECGEKLILTVNRGGIEKYLKHTRRIIEKYHLPKYYAQRLEMIEEEVRLLFEGEGKRQVSLSDFM